MMLWIGVFVLLFAFIVYLLFMPIDILINTDEGQYALRLGYLGRARIEKDENYLIRIRLNTLFTHFYFYPLKKRLRKKEKKETGVKKRRKFKWSYLRIAYRLIKSFELKQFLLELDTGNCITNARLFPTFAFLQYRGIDCQINFVERNSLVLHVQNRPVRIIKSFINP